MKPLKAEIPEETMKRIIYLAQEAKLPEETIVITALVIGTIRLNKWIKEDE